MQLGLFDKNKKACWGKTADIVRILIIDMAGVGSYSV